MDYLLEAGTGYLTLNPPKGVSVLSFNPRANRSVVKRHYLRWRQQRGLPPRCDETQCPLHDKDDPVWNGKPLNLSLDHINGVNIDNRPENLRLLCPNCHSQQSTTGGGNKGRVLTNENSYVRSSRDGTKEINFFAG